MRKTHLQKLTNACIEYLRCSWGQRNIMLGSHIDTSREKPAVSVWVYMKNILAATMMTFKRCNSHELSDSIKRQGSKTLCAEK